MLSVPRIEVDLKVCGEKSCIAGTRLAVSINLEWIENGETFTDIFEAYPFISEADIQAAVRYAQSYSPHRYTHSYNDNN